MIIQIDSREKPRAISQIVEEFDRQGIQHYVSKMYVGDYCSPASPGVVIDRKQNLSEVCNNIGSTAANHERFRREILRAKAIGIRVIVLVEHGCGFRQLSDVQKWQNPRVKKNPNATSGVKLYRIMETMAERYGIEWQFCNKSETGKRIIEILKVAET